MFGNIHLHGIDREAMGKDCLECGQEIKLYPASITCQRRDGEMLTVYLHKPCSFIYIKKLVINLKILLKKEGIKLDVEVVDKGYN
jgi:hypothetical protein